MKAAVFWPAVFEGNLHDQERARVPPELCTHTHGSVVCEAMIY